MINSINTFASATRHILLITGSIFLGLILCTLVVLEIAELSLRYILSTGIYWFADISGLLLQTLGWVGAGYLWIARSHLVVDIMNLQSSSLKRWLGILAEWVMLVGVIWITPKILQTMTIHNSIIMPTLDVPSSLKYVPMLVGILLLGTGAVINLMLFYISAMNSE